MTLMWRFKNVQMVTFLTPTQRTSVQEEIKFSTIASKKSVTSLKWHTYNCHMVWIGSFTPSAFQMTLTLEFLLALITLKQTWILSQQNASKIFKLICLENYPDVFFYVRYRCYRIGNFENSLDKTKYFECYFDGFLRLRSSERSCPPRTQFNPSKSRCETTGRSLNAQITEVVEENIAWKFNS